MFCFPCISLVYVLNKGYIVFSSHMQSIPAFKFRQFDIARPFTKWEVASTLAHDDAL